MAEGDGWDAMEVFISFWALDGVVRVEGVVLLCAYDEFDGIEVCFGVDAD